MIAHLKGTITSRSADHVVVDVGGVGYQVFVSANNLKRLPQNNSEVSLHIYTHVREDQLSLFGFAAREEKAIFQRLLEVSGVGPKLAMAVMSGMEAKDIVNAVVKEDMARLNSISGIGRKTAERIIIDLKDKFLKEFAGMGEGGMPKTPLYNDVASALMNLGYNRAAVEKALADAHFGDGATVQGVVKQVLRDMTQHTLRVNPPTP